MDVMAEGNDCPLCGIDEEKIDAEVAKLRASIATKDVEIERLKAGWQEAFNIGIKKQDQLAAANARIADLESRLATAPVPIEAAKHNKRRGSDYVVFTHGAKLQTDMQLRDYDYMTIYRGHDGTWWVRPVIEFQDGRFARSALSEVPAAVTPPYQERVAAWMRACFTPEICADHIDRNHRFFEEATELVQANGMTASEAHQLVDYTFGRPVGNTFQEVGGVMVTLMALCLAIDLDVEAAAETELARIWTKIEKIRAKQAAKPKHSPLPEHAPEAGERPQAEGEAAIVAGWAQEYLERAAKAETELAASRRDYAEAMKILERLADETRGVVGFVPLREHMANANVNEFEALIEEARAIVAAADAKGGERS
jgi:hypothetical protein